MKNQKTKNELDILNIQEILKKIPHRYPMLLIDKVIEIKKNKSAIGIKNVTANENFFTGHFPNQMIMPGVLIVEALAQATGILAFKSEVGKPIDGQIYMLVGIDKVRFKRTVEPGDQIVLKVEVMVVKRGMWKFNCRATVDGELVTSAILMCTQKAAE